jgi:hypothetical protein
MWLSGNQAIDNPAQYMANNYTYNSRMDNSVQRPNPIDPNSLPSVMPEFDKRAGAMGPSSSPWLGMQLNRQTLDQQNATDQAGANAAGQTAQARTGLAMRGGLTGGAGERLAMAGMRNAAQGQSDVLRQGMSDRMTAGIDASKEATENDWNNDRAKLSTWAGLASSEQQQKSQLMQNNYTQGMQAWAAQQAANAELQAARDAQNNKGFFGKLFS